MAPFSASKVFQLPDLGPFKSRLRQQVDLLKKEIPTLDANSSVKKIHKVRVLTRRARASFAILNKFHSDPQVGSFLKILKSLTRILGPVRSLDVSYRDLKGRIKSQPIATREKLDFVVKAMARDRNKLRGAMEKKMARKKLSKKIKKHPFPEGMPATHAGPFLRMLKSQVENSADRLKSCWKVFLKSGAIEDLHRVRISLKKWRYTMELQAECTGSPGANFFERLKSLQDRLGRLHDLEVLTEWLAKPRLKKKVKSHGAKKEYRVLRKDLELEIRNGSEAFRREGGKVLLELLKGRAA